MEEKDAKAQKPPSRICSKADKLLRRSYSPQRDITTRRPPLLVMAESVLWRFATSVIEKPMRKGTILQIKMVPSIFGRYSIQTGNKSDTEMTCGA